MSRAPSDQERDQSLERLADAYASGRLTHAEFAERSDQVFTTQSISVLESLLADLNSPTGPPIYGMAPRAYEPQPVRRPEWATSPDVSRRSLVGIGMVAAAAAIVGATALSATRGSHNEEGYRVEEYPPPQPAQAESFLDPGAVSTMFDRLWDATIASIVFTHARAVAICRPRGEGWQQLTLYTGGERFEAVEPGTNTFEIDEVDVETVINVLTGTSDELATGAPVSRVEVQRLKADDPVRVKVSVEGGGFVIWDARTPTVIEVHRGS